MLDLGDERFGHSVLYKIPAGATHPSEVSPHIREIFVMLLARREEREADLRKRINDHIDEKERLEEEERARKAAEEEEERKRAESEGAEGAEKKEDQGPKVERPEPATERVPPKEPGVNNIDKDFKPTILKVWEELSDTYKH